MALGEGVSGTNGRGGHAAVNRMRETRRSAAPKHIGRDDGAAVSVVRAPRQGYAFDAAAADSQWRLSPLPSISRFRLAIRAR